MIAKDYKAFMNVIRDVENSSEFRVLNLNDWAFQSLNGDIDAEAVLTNRFGEKLQLNAYKMYMQRIGLDCPSLIDGAFVKNHREHLEDLINSVIESNEYSDREPFLSMTYLHGDNIVACHSKDYRPLEISELIEQLKESLEKRYEKVEFFDGSYCDDLTIVDFVIRDRQVIRALEHVVSGGAKYYDAALSVRLVTSNLGLSGANLYPLFLFKTTPEQTAYSILPATEKRIILEHKGDANIEKFAKNCEKMFGLIEFLPQNIAALNGMIVHYPTHCLINVAEKVGIPAKYVRPVAEDVAFLYQGCEPTAKEIYMYLAQVIDAPTNAVERMQITEKVGRGIRLMREHLDEVDIPKIKWKRLGVLCDEGQDLIPDSDEQFSLFQEVA